MCGSFHEALVKQLPYDGLRRSGEDMKVQLAVAVCAALLVGGCSDTDWDHALSYAGLGDSKPATQPPPTVAADQTPPATEQAPTVSGMPAPADNWCTEIAQSARSEAAGQGFDARTQQLRANSAYNQCTRYPGTAQR